MREKNFIILFLLPVVIIAALALSFVTGCASARYVEISPEGEITKEITYRVVGKRELNELDVDIKTGKIKLGSSRGDAGDLAEARLNMSEVAAKLALTIP